jgi:hypothetical protein
VQFTLAHLDMDCSLANGAILAALVVTALLFGAWTAWVLRSQRSSLQRVMRCSAVLLLSYVGYGVSRHIALYVQAWQLPGMSPQLGCIISSPLSHAPVAAAVCALVFYLAAGVLRRARPVRTS